MGLLLILIAALILYWIVAPILLFASQRTLRERLVRLERQIEELRHGRPPDEVWNPEPPAQELAPAAPATAAPPPPPPPAVAIPQRTRWAEPEQIGWQVHDEEEGPRERESIGGLFERLVAGRLLIWIGGIALVVAGVYLIRYSIEIGLVTPELRMIAAALFGFLLLGAGEYARAGKLLSDDPRVAQALVGAGLAVLYAAAYGSHILYGLIGTATASGAMLAITAAALILSLRHGAGTAVMGLVGGFLTPLLVGDPDAGAVPLLAYLALLDIAVFVIAWRRGWTWLAAAAVALSFVWTGYLLTGPRDDAVAAGLFIILLAVAASLLRPGGGRQLSLIQPLLIGILQLAFLVARLDIGPIAWALFGAISAASMALALIRPEYRIAPPMALVLALALLLAKSTTGQDPMVPSAAAGIALVFGAAGLALAAWKARLLWTGIASAGLAAPFLIVRAARPELLDPPAWGLLAALLSLGPAALIWVLRDRASDKAPGDLALLIAGSAASVLLGAAVWDLLPGDLIASAWLAVAILVALAARRLGDFALTSVAAVTAMVAVARSLWMVPELSTAAITGLVGEPVLATDLPGARAALFALGLPAVLLAALRLAMPPLPLGARRALPAVAGLFAVAAAYVWFKQAFGLASEEEFVARGLIERTIVTQSLFLIGWLLCSGTVPAVRVERDQLRLGGTVLTSLAAARLIWFDMVVHNPAWEAQWVGTIPVLNLVVAEYLLGAAWLYAARRRADQATRSGFWLIAFLAALVIGVALLVRQGFQGPLLNGPGMPIAEFYVYSLAGLVVAIGLLLAGIRLPDKALRLAGLLLLTATIVKVFLVDASALEGLLRILSFLGLGIALIGVGRLYGPVLRAEAKSARPE